MLFCMVDVLNRFLYFSVLLSPCSPFLKFLNLWAPNVLLCCELSNKHGLIFQRDVGDKILAMLPGNQTHHPG